MDIIKHGAVFRCINLIAYYTYVRMYVMVSSRLTIHIHSSERVNKQFTNRMTELHDLFYNERLSVPHSDACRRVSYKYTSHDELLAQV